MQQLLFLVVDIPDDIGKVLSLETHLVDIRLGKLKFFLNVFYHTCCSSGRQRKDGNALLARTL